MSEINGWLNIYKPYGYTSARVVAIVKRKLKNMGAKKVGHGGTLDPLAEGVLPICINKATKTTQYTMAFSKTYKFHLTFGEERSTDDAEGEVTERCDKIPSMAEIEQVLPTFTGKIKQTPPKYSAIRVRGKRAYDLARKGATFELDSREVEVFSLKCNGFVQKNVVEFEVECGKGFYIRSLGRDLARALGTRGFISKLERVRVGVFNLADSIKLEELDELVESDKIKECLIMINGAVDD